MKREAASGEIYAKPTGPGEAGQVCHAEGQCDGGVMCLPFGQRNPLPRVFDY